MNIRNVTGEARIIAATGQLVAANDLVEVADDLGASLCEQVDAWVAVKVKNVKAPAGGEG